MKSRLHVLYTDKITVDLLTPIFNDLPQPARGSRIAIKPNLVVPTPADQGATTDPALVEAIVAYLQAQGHKDIRIIEGSAIGYSTERAFRNCGYEAISEKYNIPLINLQKDAVAKISIRGIDIDICKEALAADFLINVPVLKAHCQTRITCALKNLKGCISDQEKRRFHRLGLHKPIAALGQALPTHWVIVDGIIGDLTFEEGGTPINMGRIIAGVDPVLIDTYVLQLLGYDLEDVPYVSLAAQFDIGSSELSRANIIEHFDGDTPPVVAQPANPIAERYRDYIDEREACSACYGSLIYALMRYEEQFGHLGKTVRFAIGQGFLGKGDHADSDALGIGSCTKAKFKNHVPGCPPTAKRILDTLTAR